MVSPPEQKPPPLLECRSSSMMVSVDDLPVVGWLSHGGPAHPKHRGWRHPVAVCLAHYLLAFVASIGAHDLMVDRYYYYNAGREFPRCRVDPGLRAHRDRAAAFLVLYSAAILAWRLLFRREPGEQPPPAAERQRRRPPAWPVVYEYCWLCNVSLWLGAWALRTGRPVLASALCVAVGIDQLLWYVDLAGYACAGKFPVGVAKYLSWPQNAK